MSKVKIKKGDQVVVTSGRDNGREGRVMQVMPRENRAIVEGINMIKKHTRPNPQAQVQGGILEREAPIHLSNLMVVCPDTGQPTRVGFRKGADGKTQRYAKKSGAALS